MQIIARQSGQVFGDFITITAGEIISGHRVVIASNGLAYVADSSNIAHAKQVIGIATGAALTGASATIMVSGKMVEGSWAWSGSGWLYFNASGILTETRPSVGFQMVVARILSATSIFVGLQIPLGL